MLSKLKGGRKMKTCLLKSEKIFFLCIVSILLFPTFGYSQEEDISKYPSRPITYIHPYPAGTTVDLAQRIISKEAEKFLGQPIVILNKPGAGGSLGVAALAGSKPDGYTLGHTAHSPMIGIPLLEKVPYHPLKDFKFIMQWAAFNMGFVVKGDSPFNSFKDLIAYARQNPKKITYGTAGANSMPFILVKQIARKEGVQLTHIPYKATIEAQTAVLGGHLTAGAGDFTYSMVEAGQLRLLLLFREEKAVEYPQTPVLKDLGYNFAFPTFITVSAPKGLPEEIARKLEDAFTKAMKEPAFIKGMKELHLPIVYRNSKELTEYITYNYNYFEKLFKEVDLKE
jgi:tripartite-type tricarboxylate transporter receptor subunit TctC